MLYLTKMQKVKIVNFGLFSFLLELLCRGYLIFLFFRTLEQGYNFDLCRYLIATPGWKKSFIMKRDKTTDRQAE